MQAYRLAVGAIFLLLVSCVQAPPKANDNPAPTTTDAPRKPLVIQISAYMPPTHPSAQDITYNSHYPPHFPREAIVAGHYGTVILLIHVDAKGEIGEVRVEQSSGYAELDASAVDAAKHWKFIPAAKDGVPQPGWVRTPVNFGPRVSSPPYTGSL